MENEEINLRHVMTGKEKCFANQHRSGAVGGVAQVAIPRCPTTCHTHLDVYGLVRVLVVSKLNFSCDDDDRRFQHRHGALKGGRMEFFLITTNDFLGISNELWKKGGNSVVAHIFFFELTVK